MSEAIFTNLFISTFDDNHYFVDAFDNSENYYKHLRGSMGTMHEDEDCESVSSLSFDRAIGCWTKEGIAVIREETTSGRQTNLHLGIVPGLAKTAAIDFGREVSIKREKDVARLIRDTVLLPRAEREMKWAEFRETLDDTTYQQLDGRMNRFVIINADGTMELPIHVVNGSTKHFDAVDKIRVSGYLEADSSPAKVFRLVVPINWKATVTFYSRLIQADQNTAPARRTFQLTNKAKGTWDMTYADWTASIAKLPAGQFDYCEVTYVEEESGA